MSSVQVMIPPKSGYALRLASGQVLRIIDVEGMQVADVVAYAATDPSERLSQAFTRANNDSAALTVDDRLYSNLNAPLLTVVEDTVGVHDILFPVADSSMSTSLGSRARRGAASTWPPRLRPTGSASRT